MLGRIGEALGMLFWEVLRSERKTSLRTRIKKLTTRTQYQTKTTFSGGAYGFFQDLDISRDCEARLLPSGKRATRKPTRFGTVQTETIRLKRATNGGHGLQPRGVLS